MGTNTPHRAAGVITHSAMLNTMMSCAMLDRDGQPCGKLGQAGLPAGICAEHAVEVYRAVHRLAGK
jgi:hypothetical protein